MTPLASVAAPATTPAEPRSLADRVKAGERLAYRLDEVANAIGVPVSTLRSWCNAWLQHHRVGVGKRRVVLIAADTLERLLQDSQVTPRGTWGGRTVSR